MTNGKEWGRRPFVKQHNVLVIWQSFRGSESTQGDRITETSAGVVH